jgi:hypothetical protein
MRLELPRQCPQFDAQIPDILAQYADALAKAGRKAEAKAAREQAGELARSASPPLPGNTTVDLSDLVETSRSRSASRSEAGSLPRPHR